MKTVVQQIIEKFEHIQKNDCKTLPEHIFFDGVLAILESVYLDIEKQQHEQTAIHITNVLMDALDNPKGGKFSGEDEFNKYWDKTYNV